MVKELALFLEDATIEGVKPCCVGGYYIYKAIWEATIGAELVCERKSSKDRDRYAVEVKSNGNIIGNLPRKILKVCSVFPRRRVNTLYSELQ